jgi:hypothetical protein
MSDLLIHASSLGKIMTGSKSKSDPLGETCKSHLREIFIQENFWRHKDFETKMMEKGNTNEDYAIKMISDLRKKDYKKNKVTKKNGFIIGTCDIDDEVESEVLDTKCPWSIFTYMAADLSSIYEWQGQGYMDLYDRETFTLVYCLTDTPEKLIEDEIRRLMYKCTDESLFEDIREGCYLQMTYKDIPDELKIKTFTIKRDKAKMQEAYDKIKLCREYYSTLKLNAV